MPMAWERKAFPMVGGLDTKIGEYVLPAPRLQSILNAYMEKSGTLRKRKGLAAMNSSEVDATAITGWKALGRYKERLLGFTASKGYEYSSTLSRWTDRGTVMSARVTLSGVSKSDTRDSFAADRATTNGVTVTAYSTVDASTLTVRIAVSDAAGTVIADQQLSATATAPRCVVHGSVVYVFYYDTAAADLMVFLVTTTSAATITSSLSGASISVATDIQTVTSGGLYDVEDNATYGVFLAYRTTAVAPGEIKFGFVNSSGVLVNTSTLVTAAVATAVTCAVSSGLAMHAVVHLTGVNNGVYAAHHSFDGATWSAIATSGQLDSASVAIPSVVACRYDSNTVLRVFWSGDAATTTSTGFNDKFIQATFTTSSAASTRISVLRHSRIASKPFLDPDGANCIVVESGDSFGLQDTFFVIRCSDNTVIARILPSLAYAIPLHNAISRVETISGAYYFAAQYKRTLRQGSASIFGGKIGVTSVKLEYSHAESHGMVQVGESLYLAGGFLYEYDGVSFHEANFLRFVESDTVAAVASNGAGALDSSAGAPFPSYSYKIIPEATNAKGERTRGTNSGAITVQFAASDDTVTLSIPTIAHTLRSDIVFGIYRTEGTPGFGAPYYRIGQVANDTTADEVTYVDTAADSTITDEEQYYGGTGEVDNIAPQTGHIITSGNGRVFIAGVEDPNQIWVSKVRQVGDTLAFSDALKIQIPDEGGPITALAMINETLVAFTAVNAYRVRGDGPNNLGFGEFLEPELVSTDVGSASQRGTVVVPAGIMFQSTKGIHLLNQSYQVEYIGAPLEGLGEPASTPTSAIIIPRDRQVRFSYADLGTLVYDYHHGQWYVFTTYSSGPSVVWDDEYTTIVASVILREDAATYTDAGVVFYMYLKLAWVRAPETSLGVVRFRRIGLLFSNTQDAAAIIISLSGNHLAGSGVSFQTITETGIVSGAHEVSWRLDSQQFSSLQIEISDNGVATSSVVLSELVFVMGVKGGLIGRDS